MSSLSSRSGNDAINANSQTQNSPDGVSQEHLTTHGSDWLWAVFAVMLFSDLVILVWHFFVPRGQRVFHQLAVILLTTASIAYFSMASNLGYASIATEFGGVGAAVGALRQIWYVRYIDWVITTPCLLLELLLATGLPLSDIITVVFFDEVMIIGGLVGALVVSSYKWGYYTFACLALFYIWWVLIGPARSTAGVIGAEYKKSFTISAALLSFVWLLYPIAWGLADGANVISPDSEMVFYGILDVIAKPVYCFLHLFLLSKLDLTALQLSSGKFSAAAVDVAAYDREKHQTHQAHTRAHRSEPTVVENEPRTGGVSYAPKKGVFGRKGRNDGVATKGANGHHRPSESTAVSHQTSSS